MAQIEKTRKWTWSMTLVAALVGATLFGGVYGERLFGAPVQNDFQKRLREYTELVAAAAHWAPAEVGTDKLVFSSIEGMLRNLDPHTSFLAPRDYADMQDRQKGTFYGLGILVTKRNDQVTVITPLEGTPASRLGIRAGDIIAEVEGQATDELSLDEVVKRLKGPKGTTVNIRIRRVGIEEPIPLTIVREAIPTNSISYVLMIRPGIGYIRIKDFTYTTVRELDEALVKLQREGMEKLILDLRTNPGGLLDAAVGVADHFVDKGQMIVYTKGRTPDSFQEFTAPGKYVTLDLPLVVLINHGSASASEIVAGAVQDHDRGLVVGQTSWGKGLVQSVYTLPYGAGLALTTSKYYTPSGRNIQRDYTSFYDYYVADDEGEISNDVQMKDRKTFTTGTGRTVYGGGGITPDYVVKPREISRVVQILEVRSAIFNFAVEYYAKNPDVKSNPDITPRMLEDFARYAASKEIAPLDDIRAALDRPEDRSYIERVLRAEITAARFGFDASYPIRLEGDDQVAKALALLPDAARLAFAAKQLRSQDIASGAGADRDQDTASKLPKVN
ncbi:MAG TPA: S41 family peptidase [Thermoanaerobaculia bacterium]|nr:S41 family peptidase [Thermoanaerobaculia bacterium]